MSNFDNVLCIVNFRTAVRSCLYVYPVLVVTQIAFVVLYTSLLKQTVTNVLCYCSVMFPFYVLSYIPITLKVVSISAYLKCVYLISVYFCSEHKVFVLIYWYSGIPLNDFDNSNHAVESVIIILKLNFIVNILVLFFFMFQRFTN